MDLPDFSVVLDDISDSDLLKSVENMPNENENPSKDEKIPEYQRFANLSNEDLDELIEKSQSSSTKSNTKWAVKLFEGWCAARQYHKCLHEMTNAELDHQLRRFYAEARTKDGQCYSRSSLLGLRNSIERHLNNPPFNRGVKFVKNPDFQSSNQMLNSKLKTQKQDGKENVCHKSVIEPGDLLKLRSSTVLKGDTALGLLRNVWFHIVLYWCRRGVEGLRELKAESFTFCRDDEDREYATMTHDEATKNHPGGLADVHSYEKLARMYKNSEDPRIDGLSCLRLYLTKRNPHCDAFFQYPKRNFDENDTVWFENRALGINKLSTMMKIISSDANLSRIYTNHCVRATSITLWSNGGVPSRHIMNISGHRNEESLKHYNNRPTADQLRSCSDILTTALQTGQAPVSLPQQSGISSTKTSNEVAMKLPYDVAESTKTMNAASFSSNVLGPGSLFHMCNVQNVQVILQQSGGFNQPNQEENH